MRGIVSFDMDMTLLDHKDFKIPESAIEAVKRLRKNYYIVIATGRDMDNRYSLGLADEIQPDAVIHLNGTKITVGETLLYEHRMDRELVRQDVYKRQDYYILKTGLREIVMLLRRLRQQWLVRL